LFLGIFFLAAAFMAYPYLFFDFSKKIPHGAFPDVLYIVSIIHHSITASLSDVYHLPFYYPLDFTLTYGHPLFGISVFFKAFASVGLSLTKSYNLYLILALVAGAWGCYLLAKEVSGHRLFSLAFSTLFIFSAVNRIHFIWLNFHSSFWIPFIIYLFIRFFRTKKKGFAVAAAFLCFFLFFTEIYYGMFFWIFILPVFLISSLLFRMCSLREMKWLLICLLFFSLLILFVFHPFVLRQEKENLRHGAQTLLQMRPEDFLSGNSLTSLLLRKPYGGTHYFPGNLFMAALVLFFTSRLKRRKNLATWLLLAFLLALGLVLFLNRFCVQLLFLLFILLLVFLTTRGWSRILNLEKVILVTSSAFFVLLLEFDALPILKVLVPYKILYAAIPGIGGLRGIDRVVLPLAMPFWISMAAVGFRNFFGGPGDPPGNLGSKARADTPVSGNSGGAKQWALGLLIIPLLYLENVTRDYIMQPLPGRETVYDAIPFKQNQVLLEIPWDYGVKKYYQNGIYMYNWQFHQNFIMNGSGAFIPVEYVKEVNRILNSGSDPFPSDSSIRRLIEAYSVSYVIFHWDLMKSSYPRLYETMAGKMKEKIKQIRSYGKIVYASDDHTVIQVQEFVPVREIIRTYSRSHLKRNSIRMELAVPYRGELKIELNGKTVQTESIDGADVRCDFRKNDLSTDGNRIKFRFGSDVLVKTIRLEKPGP